MELKPGDQKNFCLQFAPPYQPQSSALLQAERLEFAAQHLPPGRTMKDFRRTGGVGVEFTNFPFRAKTSLMDKEDQTPLTLAFEGPADLWISSCTQHHTVVR